MIKIIIENCTMCRLEGPQKILLKLYNQYRIAHPNRYQIMMYQRKSGTKWDGYIKYISDSGSFRIGLLPHIYEAIKKMGNEITIIDHRPKVKLTPKIPTHLGDSKLYPDQKKALKVLLNNQIGGYPFLICAGDYSVGFGKSLLFCAIHKAYGSKLKTILLLNDSDLFKQFKKELPLLLPEEPITFVQGKVTTKWSNFTVAMVPSVSNNLRLYQSELIGVSIVLIDEADIIDNKTYKNVLNHLWNAPLRIGLSGTLYMSTLKKKLVHNMNIMQFIGPKIDKVSLKDQMSKGRATPVVVKVIEPDFKAIPTQLSYKDEYDQTITYNVKSHELAYQRILFNAKGDKFPMLVVTKFIDHCEGLYKYLKERLGDRYTFAYMHNQTKNREDILTDFKNGKIDILISTTIIARGKNIPQLSYILNMTSMDSQEKTIQILGRLVRKFLTKSKGYMDDINYPGKYLRRHGNHRKNYYLKEGLKVIKIKY